MILKMVRKSIFFTMFLGFALLLYLRHYFGVDFPVAVFLVAVAVIALISDKSELIALAVSCVVFPAGFQFKYAIIIIGAVYIAKKFFCYNHNKTFQLSDCSALLALFLMVAWEAIHVAVFNQSIVELVRSFVEIAFVFILLLDSKKDFDYSKIVRYVALASVLSCLLILLVQIKYAEYRSLINYLSQNRFGRGIEQYGSFEASYNPNKLGLTCFVPLTALTQLMLSRRSVVVDYILALLLIVFSIMTMSRTVVVLFIVLIVCIIISTMRYAKHSPFKIMLVIVSLFVLFYVAYLLLKTLLPSVFDSIVARFQVDDISNGRLETMKEYNELFSSEISIFLFGVGMQGRAPLLERYNIEFVSHNGLQELIIVWGVPGLFLFAFFLFFIITKNKNNFKRSLLNFYPLIIILTFSMFSQLISVSSEKMFFSVAYLSLCTCFENTETKL